MTTITQTQIDAYAAVSGDHNPLHVDPEFAAGTPFGRTIAHGHLLLGLINLELERRWPDRWASEGRLRVKFVGPVFAGDEVEIDVDDDQLALRVGERICVVGSAALSDSASIQEVHHG
jgi:3-hydroxybutyryl-CoA dehydratase